jgi:hypothetical protein
MTERRWLSTCLPAAGTLTAVTIAIAALAGCGQVPAPSASRSAGVEVATSLTATRSVPAGYSPIQGMAGNTTGPGVWFWDYSKSADTVFFEAPGRPLRSWNVLSGRSYQAQQAKSGLAAAADGDVWLGINSTLAELDPPTGTVRTWRIPAPRPNPAQARFLPSALRATRAVQAIAVSGSGDVAVAMSNSSSLAVFDTTTQAFSIIDLPSVSMLPIAVAYSGDGTLAVGTSDLAHGGRADQVLLRTAAGSTALAVVGVPGSAWEIAALTPAAFVVGAVRPDVLTQAGALTRVQAPALTGTAAAPNPIVVLPGGLLAGISASGVVEFRDDAVTARAAAASATTLKGVRTCGEDVPSMLPHGGRITPKRSCVLATYASVVADSAGNLWVIPPGNGDSVALLSKA